MKDKEFGSEWKERWEEMGELVGGKTMVYMRGKKSILIKRTKEKKEKKEKPCSISFCHLDVQISLVSVLLPIKERK